MLTAPLWSVMIPTYNAEEFLAETLSSVLQQAPDASIMEIVVVDNCSTDSTEAIVEQVGKGRIEFRPNSTNVGMMQNFNECIKQAKGNLVHILHADDLVDFGFYEEFAKTFFIYPNVSLVSCNSRVIDEYSVEKNITYPVNSLLKPSNNISELLVTNPLRTPAVVVKLEAYKQIGGFDTLLTHTADWDMWVRVIYRLNGVHLDKLLCSYREHSNNGTSRASVAGLNITDTESLYAKFAREGYPVETKKQKSFLMHITAFQFKNFYYMNNNLGMRNMFRIYIRLAGILSAMKLLVNTFLRKK